MFSYYVSITKAAKLTGKSESTIKRAIVSGKINETQILNEGDGRKIAVVELERVFGQLTTKNEPERPSMHGNDLLIKHLESELERSRTEKEEWQKRFLEVNERLTGILLPPPKPDRKRFLGIF